MICLTLGCATSDELLDQHRQWTGRGARLVEWRLDYLERPADVAALLARRCGPVIVTVRRREDGGRWQGTEAARRALLSAAIDAGADYVDLEGDAAAAIARRGTTRRIVSRHDFQGTPDNLETLHEELASLDADLVKLATMACRPHDNLRMLRLVAASRLPTVGLCMGELGTPSRILSRRFGAPFTYAAPGDGAPPAPGQVNFVEMQQVYRYELTGPRTEVFAVIGDPIAHSQSPLVHNAAFAHLGIADKLYVPFRIPPADLAQFLEDAPAYGIRGLSVTIPHKEAVIPLVSAVDRSAEGLGALNTLVFTPAGIVGYNTDVEAAIESLEQAVAGSLAGKRVLILGAGGAARAIAHALVRREAVVTVTNRTQQRADELAAAAGCHAAAYETRHEVPADVLINCSPVGMFPHVEDTPFEAAGLRPGMVVFDTVYNPEHTRLLREADRCGCTIVTGVEMFVRQAALQFRLFTGQAPPVEVMRAALRGEHRQ